MYPLSTLACVCRNGHMARSNRWPNYVGWLVAVNNRVLSLLQSKSVLKWVGRWITYSHGKGPMHHIICLWCMSGKIQKWHNSTDHKHIEQLSWQVCYIAHSCLTWHNGVAELFISPWGRVGVFRWRHSNSSNKSMSMSLRMNMHMYWTCVPVGFK